MKEYWIQFDEVCNSILKNGNQNAYDELNDAKLCVNGMTDGWYEFIIELKKYWINTKFLLQIKKRQEY